MNWDTNKAQLELLGFHVEIFDNDTFGDTNIDGAKNAFLGGIQSLTNSKSMHGLYMMGHGSEDSIGSAGTKLYTQGPEWSITYQGIGGALNYRLGALIIHACDGENTNARNLATSVESGGIFWGHEGTYTPKVDDALPIAKNWGRKFLYEIDATSPQQTARYCYRMGGKQHTKTLGDVYTFKADDIPVE